ncbi:hypothetical protein [Sphingomonas sanxanigenens]|uniref:Flagellar motor switch protein FliN-like C-terminal domain-containing protein n=1 Tax=Sphingomonas sanxanigenens DSM 19645 = NX02 TaxID=1123269 RepID=W0AEW6_9SPHN|nr:hypothetical protein [Sphingomonas sanxanigenens]AHE54843.1 hypothetical protein NX02_15815 [Sphingomonas sanxanigenens DSM 19645 = NX02]
MSERILRGLPKIDPRAAELRRAVIGALTGRRHADGVIAAHVTAIPDRRGGWLRFDNGAALAVDRIGGADARFEPEDGVAAVALVERIEPLLRTIEIALGIDLEPVDVVALLPEPATIEPAPAEVVAADAEDEPAAPADIVPAEMLVVTIMVGSAAAATMLRIALPPALTLLPAQPEFAPELIGGVAIRTRLRIEGPRLAPHDAAALAVGDCILIGAAPIAATLVAGGAIDIAGLLDPVERRFHCRPTPEN